QGHAADVVKSIRDISEAVKPMRAVPEMGEMVDAVDAFAMFSLLRVGRVDDVLAIARPKAAGAQAPWHFARAMAFAAKRGIATAKKEQDEFESSLKETNREAQWGTNKTGPVMDLATSALRARLESSPERAIAMWKRAVEIQDSLVYDEPPAWYYPLRESWG